MALDRASLSSGSDVTRFDADVDDDDAVTDDDDDVEWKRFPEPVLEPATEEGPDDDW